MNADDIAVITRMRMSVVLRWLSVSRPSRVADAYMPRQSPSAVGLVFESGKPSLAFYDNAGLVSVADAKPGRIIPAVLQLLKSV